MNLAGVIGRHHGDKKTAGRPAEKHEHDEHAISWVSSLDTFCPFPLMLCPRFFPFKATITASPALFS